ncbi:hypothetical protein Bca52824_019726 [Brassica carinata]|uniref:FAS1 domain-containing protein n=1 Tax=Brassica carinata TaxID=52824 RepID=A0A8X7VRY5_BRACI|nr:hypothetical protein Bca52824_019726 [Brassica carinata]
MSEKLVFRSSTCGDCYYHGNYGRGAYGEYLEKRQLFLRSYQFSRKQSFAEKVTRSKRRVKKFVWTRLRSARRLKRMLQITGKNRPRSLCRYQKLGHHYEKLTTRVIRHNWGMKIEGRSKGFRLNRPKRLVLKALVLPRRILNIYARITDTMSREGFILISFLNDIFLFFFLLTILASTVTEPRPTPILRHDNQSSDLFSAISDMRRESYYGFVTLLHILNDTDFFRNQEITFLMPNDEDISQADMSQESLETFILRHTIPAWLMINHMLRFPNKTLVPCSIPDKMFTITKSGGSGLFVNNARIVSPNICQNSRISCHGISNVITFHEDSFPKGKLSPKMLSSRITTSRH